MKYNLTELIESTDALFSRIKMLKDIKLSSITVYMENPETMGLQQPDPHGLPQEALALRQAS